MQGQNKVTVSQSKHIIGCVEEEEEECLAKIPRQSRGEEVARTRSNLGERWPRDLANM